MKIENVLEKIQKKLPEDIVIHTQIIQDITENEVVGILSWIKLFNKHYQTNGKSKNFGIEKVLISKRLGLDFGLYRFPSDLKNELGSFVIYLFESNNSTLEYNPKDLSLNQIIKTYNL